MPLSDIDPRLESTGWNSRRLTKVHFAGILDDPARSLIPLAQVLLGQSHQIKHHPHFLNAFDELIEMAPQTWQAVSLADAEVVVYAHWLDKKPGEEERAETVSRLARAAGLPCVFFQLFDHGVPCIPSYGLVYQPSILSDEKHPNERAMVPPVDDMLADRGGRIVLRTKGERPKVSFCGNVGSGTRDLLFRLIGRPDNAVGPTLRRKALRILTRDGRIESDFIYRRSFWGGAMRSRKPVRETQVRLRKEYLCNMLDADYTICMRGAGNFSFRFYEALSAGRIPLLVNTRCVLPFDDRIDWSKHALIVDQSDLHNLVDRVCHFHQSVSPQEFENMQISNRQLWARWLSPFSFYERVLEDCTTTRGHNAA